jgi:type II secretory pathway component PulK
VRKGQNLVRNSRGVALIIVLLVTALLIALIFEFAYGTRVSLRAAANYRNSQRAYFLARSGFGVFARFPDVRGYSRQGELSLPVPYVSEGDKVLQLLWEDESGKINITNISKGNDAYNRLTNLFLILQIDQNIIDEMSRWQSQEQRGFYLLTELHRFLSDEDYGKVEKFLTVSTTDNKININTASSQVLQSLGFSAPDAAKIAESAQQEPYGSSTKPINSAPGVTTMIASQLVASSNVYKVRSVATVGAVDGVGGYKKQIDVIMTLGGLNGYTVNYWRAL